MLQLSPCIDWPILAPYKKSEDNYFFFSRQKGVQGSHIGGSERWALCVGPFTPENIGTSWIEGWLGPRDGLDILVKAEVYKNT
jgi:hypothetical protein